MVFASYLVFALGPTFDLPASPRSRSFSLCAVLSEDYFQAGQQGHAAHHAQARRRLALLEALSRPRAMPLSPAH